MNGAQELGQIIGKMSQSQSDFKNDSFGDDEEGLLDIGVNEFLVTTGSLALNGYLYATDSFVLDHPVYGDLNNPVLKLDGGYKQRPDVYYPSWPMAWDHAWGVPSGDDTYLIYETDF